MSGSTTLEKIINLVTDLEKAYTTQGKTLVTDFEKNITLAIVDEAWKKHLRKMDELKQSVQLAVHEQKDPLLIYKFEAFNLFKKMIDDVLYSHLLYYGATPIKPFVVHAHCEHHESFTCGCMEQNIP